MKTEVWPWIRAGLAMAVVIAAVLVWNPEFMFVGISGIWDPYHQYPLESRANAVSVLVLGAAALGCLESVRRPKRQ